MPQLLPQRVLAGKPEAMTRVSGDELREGRVFNGFDIQPQVQIREIVA